MPQCVPIVDPGRRIDRRIQYLRTTGDRALKKHFTHFAALICAVECIAGSPSARASDSVLTATIVDDRFDREALGSDYDVHDVPGAVRMQPSHLSYFAQ